MLGPAFCGTLSRAPLLPKLRGHFAEFLDNASPVGLGLLALSTCVGFRYGSGINYSGFSRQCLQLLRYFISLLITYNLSEGGFSSLPAYMLDPAFPFPASLIPPRPHSSVIPEHRNLHLSSIGYAFRPRLRSRLTRGRSASPRKPWIFGRKDSHLTLATHSGILSSKRSAAPSGTVSSPFRMLPYRSHVPVDTSNPQASVSCFSPGNFRRRTSRLVSYYALFECVAASEPTS